MQAKEQQTSLKPYVVHTVGDATETAQTPGMVRQPAVMPGKGDTSKIWMGKVTAAPREKGPPHTHLEAETAAYLIQGYVRVWFGENFEEWIEAGPGRFHLRAGPHPAHRGESLRRGDGGHPVPGARQHSAEPLVVGQLGSAGGPSIRSACRLLRCSPGRDCLEGQGRLYLEGFLEKDIILAGSGVGQTYRTPPRG